MRLRHTMLLAALLAAILLAEAGPLQAQCSMCRTALTHSAEGRAMGESFNHAILLMLAAPYAVFAVVGAALFRERLRLWALRRFRR